MYTYGKNTAVFQQACVGMARMAGTHSAFLRGWAFLQDDFILSRQALAMMQAYHKDAAWLIAREVTSAFEDD